VSAPTNPTARGGPSNERLAATTVSGGDTPSRRFGRLGTSAGRDSITPEELRSLAPSKYGAKRTHVPALGRTFASKHEATVAVGLALRQEMGEIRALEFQVGFLLDVNGVAVGRYVADFRWEEPLSAVEGGWWRGFRTVVADAKGYPTPVYRLKKKLMKAVHGIDVVEL
jgi:hypothetical protein